jgi:hypothetical protein
MTACIQAGWPSMKVEPLQESQKMQIITDYLEGIYGKTLNETQKSMIVNVKQTSNPLYLKSLLDEVCDYFVNTMHIIHYQYLVIIQFQYT